MPRQIGVHRDRSVEWSTFPRDEKPGRRKRERWRGDLLIANARLKNSISRNTTDLICGHSTAVLDLGSGYLDRGRPDLCCFPGGRPASSLATGPPVAESAGAKPGH